MNSFATGDKQTTFSSFLKWMQKAKKSNNSIQSQIDEKENEKKNK